MIQRREQYEALTRGAGWCDLRSRSQVELTGEDRGRFLHNLCTNDVLRLIPGGGCEAFVTNVQGKTIGHVYVFCGSSSLIVDTVAGQADMLISHFDRYLIREEVQLHDRTQLWGELLLSGDRAEQLLSDHNVAIPTRQCDHLAVELAGHHAWLRRVDLAGPTSLLLSGTAESLDAVTRFLPSIGFVWCSEESFNMARIEAGTPVFGHDITEKNLPQEVDRNDRAVSFRKGCYLGQETVARIDALGHVNRTLVGVRFISNDVPPVDAELRVNDQVVGRVTSAAFSPRLNAPLALAYVRRGSNAVGSSLQSDFGEAEVIPFPV